MTRKFATALRDHIAVFERMRGLEEEVSRAALIIVDALNQGGKVMFCGNGGSAADAQHLAAELVGRFIDDRRSLAALSLAADSSALTCIGNDFGSENVFARQVAGLGQAADVLVAISTSGKSVNVLRGAEAAKQKGIKVVSMTGSQKSELHAISDVSILVPSSTTAHIQEAHIFVGHYLCGEIEALLGL